MKNYSHESFHRRSSGVRIAGLALALLATLQSPTALAQQQPDPQEILRQIQQGQIPQGVQPLTARPGTWSYPIKPGLHTEMLKEQTFADAKGIDATFLAKASVFVTRVESGPDLCNPGHQGISDVRVIALQVGEPSPPDTGGPRNRLIVNQEQSLAMLDLQGEIREWKPGREFCGGEKQMTEASRGEGRLVLEYQTQHLAPLNFTASPRPHQESEGSQGSGFLSWNGGLVELDVRPPAAGVPAAMVNGPAQSVSISDALAMARELSGREVPSVEQIESELPDGISLDALPITLTGNATAGSINRWQTYEWNLAYVLQVDDAGKRVDDRWLHRGAGE